MLLRGLLQEVDPQIKGNGVETAGEDDTCAALLRRLAVGVDHLPHPGRLTAQVHVIGAGFRADAYQFRTIELVRADGGQHDFGALNHRFQARQIFGIGNNQRRAGRRADFIAYRFKLALAAAGHGPAQVAVVAVFLAQILGYQAAGIAGRAVNDDVELTGVAHQRVLMVCRGGCAVDLNLPCLSQSQMLRALPTLALSLAQIGRSSSVVAAQRRLPARQSKCAEADFGRANDYE